MSGDRIDLLKRIQDLERREQPQEGIMLPTPEGDYILSCPNCHKPIVNVWSKALYQPNYCHYCGQKLK